ncbi:hypothetical protein Q4514_18320 [Celeribacter halophilus]|uniref:hypothetical protein n=1 Tax=Celeribacter halophilus TaxID=576117 RepID=UPI0026E28AC1|nr:hypothetical protein [Celeribacter halophilus]MDO6512454.1 hypothetical protein [Celeribacter halophilus]
MPEDLPTLYHAHIEDLVGTLSNEAVAGAASDELHELIDSIDVCWEEDKKQHTLELRGKLLEMLIKAMPSGTESITSNSCSLKLVAGVGFEPTTFRL